MKQLAVAWTLCLLASGVAAESTPGQPTLAPQLTQPSDNTGRDMASTQPQGAPPAPIVVNVQTPSRPEAEVQKEDRERKEKTELDKRLVELTGDLAYYTKLLAWSTIVLTIATAGLFAFAVLQARDAKSAGRAARKSARAANRSAKAAETALIGIDRPYIFLARPILFLFAHQQHRYPHAEYYIKNFGRTPAIIKRRVYGLKFVENIPDIPPYQEAVCLDDYTVIEATGEILGEAAQANSILKDSEVELARSNALKSLFFGRIEYEDTFGTRYEMGFGYVRQPYDGRHASNEILGACEHPGYNYHRKADTRRAATFTTHSGR